MEPITFAEVNKTWNPNGEDGYLPLPTYIDDRHTISCWQLAWRERIKVLLFGQLWLTQLNFGRALQPLRPSIDPPFVQAEAPK